MDESKEKYDDMNNGDNQDSMDMEMSDEESGDTDQPAQTSPNECAKDTNLERVRHDDYDVDDSSKDSRPIRYRDYERSPTTTARNNRNDKDIDGDSYDRKDRDGRLREDPHHHHHHDNTNDNDNDYNSNGYDDRDNNDRASSREPLSKSKNIIYVTNISPIVTLEQMKILFGFVGDIVDIKMYQFESAPSSSAPGQSDTNFKVCFVEFTQHSSVLVAQHLTNTVFIDRAIFILPFKHSIIPPDRTTAIEQGYTDTEYVTKFNDGVLTQVASGPGGAQVITTADARLAASSLQTYPQLPINTDPTRVEEIRRTLYIGNLDSSLPPEQVLKFFNDMGEVKYIRIAGDENQPTRFAFVEFTNQASVANALLHHGFVLGSRSLKINHSNNPIVKPQPKLEIDDSSKRLQNYMGASKTTASSDYRSLKESSTKSSHHHLPSSSSHHHHHYHQSSRSGDSRRDRRRDYDYSSRRRSRSRDRHESSSSRSRRSRSREYTRRSSRSPVETSRRRSRSRDDVAASKRRQRSRSRSAERPSKHRHKSSSSSSTSRRH